MGIVQQCCKETCDERYGGAYCIFEWPLMYAFSGLAGKMTASGGFAESGFCELLLCGIRLLSAVCIGSRKK